jgi:hypothetical protein
MACGVPVLGANIGGIPDFVKDGHNGLLFTANSRASLRDTLVKAIENPRMVWGLRKDVTPPKSIEEHAVEIEAVYSGIVPSAPGAHPVGAVDGAVPLSGRVTTKLTGLPPVSSTPLSS